MDNLQVKIVQCVSNNWENWPRTTKCVSFYTFLKDNDKILHSSDETLRKVTQILTINIYNSINGLSTTSVFMIFMIIRVPIGQRVFTRFVSSAISLGFYWYVWSYIRSTMCSDISQCLLLPFSLIINGLITTFCPIAFFSQNVFIPKDTNKLTNKTMLVRCPPEFV